MPLFNDNFHTITTKYDILSHPVSAVAMLQQITAHNYTIGNLLKDKECSSRTNCENRRLASKQSSKW